MKNAAVECERMTKGMIRVLIVEDSIVARELLRHILDSDPDIEVIGAAKNAAETFEFLAHSKPDLITMDINLPDTNGFEITRRIMEREAVPIVIVTASWDAYSQDTIFRSLEAGALTVRAKPRGPGSSTYEEDTKELLRTVKLMSEIKVVTRHSPRRWEVSIQEANIRAVKETHSIEIIAMGASTGGPAVIRQILEGVSPDGDIPPLLIVQHIAEGFLKGLVHWLEGTTGHKISIATGREKVASNRIYFAPDHFHMGVDATGRIHLSRATDKHQICPSVSHLFESIARAYGPRAAGILLTGMGTDGAAELKIMKDNGSVTVAQRRESVVVYGMPGEAERLGAAKYFFGPEEIARFINRLKNVPDRVSMDYKSNVINR
jgi:two-component system chemotaxis response regulator CheB